MLVRLMRRRRERRIAQAKAKVLHLLDRCSDAGITQTIDEKQLTRLMRPARTLIRLHALTEIDMILKEMNPALLPNMVNDRLIVEFSAVKRDLLFWRAAVRKTRRIARLRAAHHRKDFLHTLRMSA